jgi:2-methylcitrate dehydratase PrpD
VAIAVIYGAAGEKQYSDRAVRDLKTIALRDKVTAVVDSVIKPEQVDMTIVLNDGRKLHKFIEHAIGSVEVPMTDQQLETKFVDLADGILPKAQVQALMSACWRVEELHTAATLAKTAVQKT